MDVVPTRAEATSLPLEGAHALPPARPNALQGLGRPVIDPGVPDGEHEQVAAPQLNTHTQGSHLRHRLPRLAEALRADLVSPLLRVHRSKPSLRPAFPATRRSRGGSAAAVAETNDRRMGVHTHRAGKTGCA